mmetsp:Transcript_34715/g.77918  ORF Transcript_34715/g.77918 Transcript_34715/m.77918 type:complete len:443 (+) Transcript_34715:76-1404(+)
MGLCAGTCCTGEDHDASHITLFAERPNTKQSIKAPLISLEENATANDGIPAEEVPMGDGDDSQSASPMGFRHAELSTDTFTFLNREATQDKIEIGDSESQAESAFGKLVSNKNLQGLVDEVRIMTQEVIAEEQPEKAVENMKDLIETLIDREYDILAAELVLREMELHLGGGEEWQKMLASKLFERFSRKASYFFKVGRAVCSDQSKWLCIYEGGGSNITALVDKDDPCLIHYKAYISISTSLTNVMAVANEVQLMREWNALVTKEPRRIGRYTAHYLVLAYQLSLLGGLYKLDVLNEIRRFTDIDGGFLVEYILSADKTHPCYQEAEKGYKRPQNELKNVWVACGKQHTVLIQMGKVKLPFKASPWLLSAVGKLAGSSVVSSLVKNSLRSSEPGSPWEAPLKEDVSGFYARLRTCEVSAASHGRTPVAGGGPVVNLGQHFD